jgi:hypothetical protein
LFAIVPYDDRPPLLLEAIDDVKARAQEQVCAADALHLQIAYFLVLYLVSYDGHVSVTKEIIISLLLLGDCVDLHMRLESLQWHVSF